MIGLKICHKISPQTETLQFQQTLLCYSALPLFPAVKKYGAELSTPIAWKSHFSGSNMTDSTTCKIDVFWTCLQSLDTNQTILNTKEYFITCHSVEITDQEGNTCL